MKLQERFVDLFELPQEILLKHPLLLVMGDRSIYLENHQGIELFESKKIQIIGEQGRIRIEGEELVIQEIHPNSLRIKGLIGAIHFIFPGGDNSSE